MSKSSSVKVTARIRRFMPWEEDNKCYEIQDETSIGLPAKQKGGTAQFVGNQKVQQMNFMNFNAVFDRECDNEHVFNHTAKTLCDNMMETGFNSLLFAYGQTGSGKTFTLLGNPGKNDGVKGVLTYAIDYLLNHPSDKVSKCLIKVCAVYSTSVKKIEMFDLFDPKNVTTGDWDNKNGQRDISDADIIKKEITRDTDVNALIVLAQSAAHYAPTGKNPQSSRGHTAFIIEVQMKDGHRCDFVCLDLAGSEGITAITPDFIKKVGEATAKVRLLEGGAINYGLQQIQKILKEVGSKKGVDKTQGTGIRKLLWPYVQKANSPMVTVLFTLSPSWTNINTTRDTFRVATAMAGLKIKPVRVTKAQKPEEIIRELKKAVREKDLKISKLQSEIVTLKEGVDSHVTRTPVMQLQRQMTKQLEHTEHTEELHLHDSEMIEYNVHDLSDHKQGLIAYKRQLTTLIEAGDDNALLQGELEDINEEIETAGHNIVAMAQLEQEMDSAIKSDAGRNSILNQRVSGKLENKGFKQALLGLSEDAGAEEEYEEDMDIGDYDSEFVKVNKADLILLKSQLDELAKSMQSKKEKAKKRNQDLMSFVDKLQSEQKELLTDLDSRISQS